jgi:hypothetical protein
VSGRCDITRVGVTYKPCISIPQKRTTGAADAVRALGPHRPSTLWFAISEPQSTSEGEIDVQPTPRKQTMTNQSRCRLSSLSSHSSHSSLSSQISARAVISSRCVVLFRFFDVNLLPHNQRTTCAPSPIDSQIGSARSAPQLLSNFRSHLCPKIKSAIPSPIRK